MVFSRWRNVDNDSADLQTSHQPHSRFLGRQLGKPGLRRLTSYLTGGTTLGDTTLGDTMQPAETCWYSDQRKFTNTVHINRFFHCGTLECFFHLK